MVQGKPAREYYAQFVDDGKGKYVSGAAAFPAQPNGDNLYVAYLFMQKDGAFVLFYSEGTGKVSPYGHQGNVRAGRRLSGRWDIARGELVLGDRMRCGGIAIDGREGLHCRLEEAVGQAAAVGRLAALMPGSGLRPDDSRFAEYQ